MAPQVNAEGMLQMPMCRLGKPPFKFDCSLLTNLSSDSEGSTPRPPPTSIEAILSDPDVLSQESADHRLEAVKNWTNVTDDASLLVRLLAAWHTWEFRYFHFLDWDSFLDDMGSGHKDFCSKLLVNSLLASASVSAVRHFDGVFESAYPRY